MDFSYLQVEYFSKMTKDTLRKELKKLLKQKQKAEDQIQQAQEIILKCSADLQLLDNRRIEIEYEMEIDRQKSLVEVFSKRQEKLQAKINEVLKNLDS